MTYERTFLAIAATVTILWAIATLVQIVTPTRPVPPALKYVMMSVAGCFFGGSVLSAYRRKNGSDDPYGGPGGYYRTGGS